MVVGLIQAKIHVINGWNADAVIRGEDQ